MIKKWMFGFMFALAGGLVAVGLVKAIDDNEVVAVVHHENEPAYSLVHDKPVVEGMVDFKPAVEKSIDAVVHIKTNTTVTYNDPFQELFFGYGSGKQTLQASGSGVIVNSTGYIVTNNHVIKDADEIEISLNDKRTFKAEVVGTDPATDLALIKVDGENLPHISYGNSDELAVGEWVLAVGNPFNLTSTVTAGIVSAKRRDINIIGNSASGGALESFIQTDAAVNPGNSGGALVNAKGDLVGINTAIKSNTGSYTGYSFAVPVNIVKKVMKDLVEYGKVQRGYIGVSIRNIDETLAKKEDIPTLKGAFVQSTMANGAAAQAGIKYGDVITKVGKVRVTNVTELQEQVAQFRPGDKVDVTLFRSGKSMIVPVTLKDLKGSTELSKESSTETRKVLGARLSDIDDEDMHTLNIKGGIKVTEVLPGKFRSVGIKEGFIITKVDHKKVYSVKEFNEAVSKKNGGILIEGVYPNGKTAYYGFGL